MVKPLSLRQAAAKTVAEVGGKAQALGRLIAFGAPVPPGFVVPPDADLDAGADAILAAFGQLTAAHVAVRSSAAGEDSQGKSWAGQFESYLYVSRADLLARIADCRASGASGRAQAYDQAKSSMPVAVVVQVMVPATVAGVLFTANPVTGARDQIMIEAVYGLGEQLVQGLATPDNYLLDKSTHRLQSQSIAVKPTQLIGTASGITEQPVATELQDQPALSPPELSELSALAADLEAKFGHPLDIEFAYNKALYVLQARPITTLTGKTS